MKFFQFYLLNHSQTCGFFRSPVKTFTSFCFYHYLTPHGPSSCLFPYPSSSSVATRAVVPECKSDPVAPQLKTVPWFPTAWRSRTQNLLWSKADLPFSLVCCHVPPRLHSPHARQNAGPGQAFLPLFMLMLLPGTPCPFYLHSSLVLKNSPGVTLPSGWFRYPPPEWAQHHMYSTTSA